MSGGVQMLMNAYLGDPNQQQTPQQVYGDQLQAYNKAMVTQGRPQISSIANFPGVTTPAAQAPAPNPAAAITQAYGGQQGASPRPIQTGMGGALPALARAYSGAPVNPDGSPNWLAGPGVATPDMSPFNSVRNLFNLQHQFEAANPGPLSPQAQALRTTAAKSGKSTGAKAPTASETAKLKTQQEEKNILDSIDYYATSGQTPTINGQKTTPVQLIEANIRKRWSALSTEGVDPNALINYAYEQIYGMDRAAYWKQADAKLAGG